MTDWDRKLKETWSSRKSKLRKAKASPKESPVWKIEKGIPIPEKGSGPRYKTHGMQAAFSNMSVGDSMFSTAPRNIVASACGNVTLIKGYYFTSRSVEGGVRVWRIE